MTLRRLRAADAAAIFRRYGQDRVVARYLSWRPLAAQAFCHAENPASARVMEKVGLTFEGVVRRHTVYPNVSDEPQDSLLYARVRVGQGVAAHFA